jgi:hypothetical protein
LRSSSSQTLIFNHTKSARRKKSHAQKTRQRTRKSLSKAAISAVAGHGKDDARTKLPAAESEQTKQEKKETKTEICPTQKMAGFLKGQKKITRTKTKKIFCPTG